VTAFVQTYTGKPFYPLQPRVEDICLEDIAHALSLLCRFGGHVERFYSVAEHCVLLSYAVDPEHARWALLHDATEAYVGDVVWPLKELLPEYKRVEDNLMWVICKKFYLDPEQPAQVKEYDRRIVIDERDALMAAPQLSWPALEGYQPLGVKVEGLPPWRAEAVYTARFIELFNENKEI
jgi:hypothetical protein